MNKFIINSPIEISGVNDDKPYIELTTRLCYLDYLNLNGVGLSSIANDSFETLKDMPIVAKINAKGDKFGSHEVSKDSKGNINYGTNAYGTHVDVWVQDDEVEIPNIGKKTVPCLFAKSKVWKRFSNVVDLIINKMENPEKYNGGLYSSWELQGEEYHKEQGGKMYDKFTFLSNCLIDCTPAYLKNSKTLSIASKELDDESFSLEIAEAWEKDIINFSNEDNDININDEGGNVMGKNKKEGNENSSLNIMDLYSKLDKALNPEGWYGNAYYSIFEHYPEDHKVICRNVYSELTDEVYVFPYTVENDEVSVGECKVRKMSELLSEKTNVNIQVNLDDTAKLLSEKEIKINEIMTENSTLIDSLANTEKELAEAGSAIAELTKEKETLSITISELEPYKTKVMEMEQAELDRQLLEKKDELKKFALEDSLIEASELETDEKLNTIISELTLENYEVSQEKIELIKGRKALQKFKASKEIAQSEVKEEVETSEVKEENSTSQIKTDLNDGSNDGLLSAVDIIKSMVRK